MDLWNQLFFCKQGRIQGGGDGMGDRPAQTMKVPFSKYAYAHFVTKYTKGEAVSAFLN